MEEEIQQVTVKLSENTKSQTTAKIPLGMNEEIARQLAELKAKREQEKPRLLKEYGLSTLASVEIDKLLKAEADIAKCKECKGEPCCKATNPYHCRVIQVEKGELWIRNLECKFGEVRRVSEMCRYAGIPTQYIGKTFADFSETPENAKAKKIAQWYLAKRPPKSLFVYGECGAGKTMLASITAQEFVRDNKRVLFKDVPHLLEELKSEFNGGDVRAKLESYSECDLLILDDFGAGQITEWNVGIMYQIINARYNASTATIITSNFGLKGLQTRLADRDCFNATRITSRLSEMCIPAFLGTVDRRRKS